MVKNRIRTLSGLIALVLAGSALAGCSSKDNETTSKTNSGDEVSVYLDENGPYYTDSEGTKQYFSMENSDGIFNADDLMPDSIYGNFDQDGLKFSIPDEWYAVTTYGSPVIMADDDEKADEYISFVTTDILTEDSFDKISKETVKTMFDGYVKEGYYTKFEINPTDSDKISGFDTKAFEVVMYSSIDDGEGNEEEISYFSKYIFIDSGTPYTLLVNSDNIEANKKDIASIADAIIPTIEISAKDGNDVASDEVNAIDIPTDTE